LLAVIHQLLGLRVGGLWAYARFALGPLTTTLVERRRDPGLLNMPFATQLRCHLERLGLTGIKRDQLLEVCEVMLPHTIADELKNLFNK